MVSARLKVVKFALFIKRLRNRHFSLPLAASEILLLADNFTIKFAFYSLEAATRGVLGKKVLFEIPQNLQENTCARASFLIKLPA